MTELKHAAFDLSFIYNFFIISPVIHNNKKEKYKEKQAGA